MSEKDGDAGRATSDDLVECHKRDARHWQAQFEAAHWERAEIRQELQAARARIAALEAENRTLRNAGVTAYDRISALEEGLRRIAFAERLTDYGVKPLGIGECRSIARALLSPPVEAPSDVHPQETGR